MISVIYFSPTGNVRYLARELVECLGNDRASAEPLEFVDTEQLEAGDHLVIMYSIHAFNPPRTVRRFVKTLPGGLFERVSLLAVGCAESWINDDVNAGLRKKLEAKGYRIAADTVLAMPLSFVMKFPQDVARTQVTVARERIGSLARDILEGRRRTRRPGLASRIVRQLGKAEDPAARMFGLDLRANQGCTSCGLCVRDCPEKNISMGRRGRPVFHARCLMCMRCIYQCPEGAIQPMFSRFIPIAGGYDVADYTSDP